jgi:hypothetical protein
MRFILGLSPKDERYNEYQKMIEYFVEQDVIHLESLGKGGRSVNGVRYAVAAVSRRLPLPTTHAILEMLIEKNQ